MERKPQVAAVETSPQDDALMSMRVERYQVDLKDAITGEVLGFGGGDTPEEAAQRAIEDARVSGELEEPLETNDDGVRD